MASAGVYTKYKPGSVWGRLTIVSRDGNYANCKCKCGKLTRTLANGLGTHTNSCGCLRKDYPAAKTHGQRNTRLYAIWCNLKQRAGKRVYYEHVRICKKWNTFTVFQEWALSHGYADDLSIDRIHNSKGYSPSNCRWVTRVKQNRNRRRLFKHNTSGYKNVCKKLDKWVAFCYIERRRVYVGQFDTPEEAYTAQQDYIKDTK